MRPDIYGRIAERARPQLGLITYDQLDELTVTRHQRRGLVSNGGWERRGHRVLADRSAPRTWQQDALAAVLDAGLGSVLTGLGAGRVWSVPGFERASSVDVLAKRGGNHRPLIGTLHETFWLPDHHRAQRGGIPVVSVARLPFELAPLVSPSRLRWVIDFSMNERGLTRDALALVVAELCRRGKPGSAAMRRQLDDLSPGYVPPASVMEARFRDLCRSNGLPEGVRQLNAGGEAWVGRVDVAFPAHKVLVELDSRRWHNTRAGFESDRDRTNALVLAGWRVVRITWRMLHDHPERVVELLRSCLCGESAA